MNWLSWRYSWKTVGPTQCISAYRCALWQRLRLYSLPVAGYLSYGWGLYTIPICECARNVHHNSIKSEYYQCIGFKFRLDFSIRLSRGDRQRLRKIIMIILLHKIISIIHLSIVFIINLLHFHASVVASCLAATELRNLTQI